MMGKFLGCVPWPSEARPSARECGETETETVGAAATACDGSG